MLKQIKQLGKLRPALRFHGLLSKASKISCKIIPLDRSGLQSSLGFALFSLSKVNAKEQT